MIDLQRARELLKQAMETQGRDFQYCNVKGGCFYEPTEFSGAGDGGKGDPLPENDNRRKTGCLIGVALTLAAETRHVGSTEWVNQLWMRFPDMMTREAAAYFAAAQGKQDIGKTWGVAYDYAESTLVLK